jgi:hypothetical protein
MEIIQEGKLPWKKYGKKKDVFLSGSCRKIYNSHCPTNLHLKEEPLMLAKRGFLIFCLQ